MTEEIIIDVSNCSHKSDDDCMKVPICNEYGDLMGYQSCEAQTLCPYRSQKKIERLEQENKNLQAYKDVNEDFKKAWDELNGKYKQLRSALEEIKAMINHPDYRGLLNKIEDRINEVLK